MAHQYENGFQVGEPAWHQLGKLFETPPATSAEAVKAAGLDWPVVKRRIFWDPKAETSTVQDDGSRVLETPMTTDKHFVLVRVMPEGLVTAEGEPIPAGDDILTTCSDVYEPVQNVQAFEFFDPLVKAGFAQFETGGSLARGRRIWVMAKLNSEIVVGRDDIVKPYCLLANSHDGSLAVNVGLTTVRVVCQNTLTMALDGDDDFWKLAHRKGVGDRLMQVQEAIGFLSQQIKEQSELYNEMLRRQAGQDVLDYLIADSLAYKEPGSDLELTEEEAQQIENAKARFEAKRNKIRELHESGQGATADTRGTLWGALNAITEFADHYLVKRARDKVNYSIFGEAQKVKERALDGAKAALDGDCGPVTE